MTATQRTIAELIGWERDGDGWTHPNHPDTIYMFTHPEPTPDDLLAWLRGQGWAAELSDHGYDEPAWLTDVPVCLNVFCVSESHGVEGPTLLAALEAAVRAVAGES
jgi:hypothetical protein